MIRVNRPALIAAVDRAAKVTDPRGSIPTLSCVRLEHKAKRLHYRATDLTLALSGQLEASGEALAFCVNARAFSGLLGVLDGDELRIEKAPTGVKLSANGKRSVRIQTIPADEFPVAIEEPREFTTLPGDALRRVIEMTLYAAAPDSMGQENRKLVRLTTDGELLTATTVDGHRGCRASVACVVRLKDTLLPRRTAQLLAGTKHDEIGIAERDGRLFFQLGGEILASATPDVMFPPFDNIVPNNPHSIEAPTADLLSSLRAVRQVGQEAIGVFEFTPDALRISSDIKPEFRGELGADTDDELAIECPAKLRVGAGCRYLEEAIGNCPAETLTIRYSGDPEEPILFTAPNYMGLVAPIRL